MSDAVTDHCGRSDGCAGGLIALGETRHANANTHVRELYTRAVDQLGADKNTIPLGGIHALDGGRQVGARGKPPTGA
ncbi:hypothetical protein [Frankia sp. EAN1pec]|uniref:hypothetical protein n=1 Tax=Parafrankia sp. (strain EAN1pec) TaxID=298653 RepID=UPI0002EA39D4